MDMVFSSLLQTVMTMITPFLPYLEKGAGKAVEEVGKKAGSELWEVVQPALEARPAAREAAADLATDPGDEQALTVVSHQLKKSLQADSELLATVRALVEKAAPAMTATVHGGGAVAQGPGAVAAGAGGTAVGGSVQGDLVIGSRSHPPHDIPRIRVPKSELHEFCRRHHIIRLALFGSVLGDDFGPDSDVDVLVDFETGHVPGLRFIDLQDELSRLFGGRRVDLVTRKSIGRRLRPHILQTAQVQYDRT